MYNMARRRDVFYAVRLRDKIIGGKLVGSAFFGCCKYKQ